MDQITINVGADIEEVSLAKAKCQGSDIVGKNKGLALLSQSALQPSRRAYITHIRYCIFAQIFPSMTQKYDFTIASYTIMHKI